MELVYHLQYLKNRSNKYFFCSCTAFSICFQLWVWNYYFYLHRQQRITTNPRKSIRDHKYLLKLMGKNTICILKFCIPLVQCSSLHNCSFSLWTARCVCVCGGAGSREGQQGCRTDSCQHSYVWCSCMGWSGVLSQR